MKYNKRWGVLDKQGEWAIAPKFDYVDAFYGGVQDESTRIMPCFHGPDHLRSLNAVDEIREVY